MPPKTGAKVAAKAAPKAAPKRSASTVNISSARTVSSSGAASLGGAAATAASSANLRGSGVGAASLRRSAAAMAAAAQAEKVAAAEAEARLLAEKSKPLRTFVSCGPVTCMAVNHMKSDLLCVGTAHGDMAVIASDVADPVLAEEAGGNPEPVSTSNIQRNAHRKKITGIVCDAHGRFVTCSGDGSIKVWAVDPAVNIVPVCVKTLFPSEFAIELEKPVVAPQEKKFEVPEVTCVVVSEAPRSAAASDDGLTTDVIIFAGYSDGVLRKWVPDTTNKCVQRVQPSAGRITCMSMLQDELLCCAGDSGVVSAFPGGDMDGGEAIQVQWPEPIRCVVSARVNVPPTSLKNLDPQPATFVFCGASSGTIYGFDVATGARKCALKYFGTSSVTSVTDSLSGNSAVTALVSGPNCLLSGHDNGCVLLWNVLDWSVVAQFWHQPVDGKSSALSSAVLFRLPDDPMPADFEDERGPASSTNTNNNNNNNGSNSPKASSSLNNPNGSPSAGRPGSASVARSTEAAGPPPPKLALVTASMAGSVHVLTQIVTESVGKLHDAEREKARGIISALKAKRAEEKANKRRM